MAIRKKIHGDQDGLAIWYKRLEQGTLKFPTDNKAKDDVKVGIEISSSEVTLRLGGIDLRIARKRDIPVFNVKSKETPPIHHAPSFSQWIRVRNIHGLGTYMGGLGTYMG